MSDKPEFKTEPTTWSPGLIGFYASCAAVSIGAAVAAMVLVVFPDEDFTVPAAGFGIFMVVGGGIGCWRCLKAARHES